MNRAGQMKALVFDNGLSIREMPIPIPKPDEALIRVLSAGICRTDIEITRGYMNFRGILGHEFVGIVEEAGNEYLVGERVVGEINCPCGQCTYCQMEMPRHCSHRTVLGIYGRPGAFAEYLTLPEENLHLVPDTILDDIAVFTEPLAAAFRITEQIHITAGDYVIVIGDGKLGQLIAQVLWLYTKNVVCVGRHKKKLELLASLSGVAIALENERISGGADVVVEASGNPSGLEKALSLVRPEGTIILKTTCSSGFQLESVATVVNEVRILGSRCGPFRPALQALSVGTVEVAPLISESYRLEDGVYALTRAEDLEVMKIILHM